MSRPLRVLVAEDDPGLREVSLALGDMYRARGDSAKAIEQYNQALDDIALRPAAYVGLARTESAQGRNALALDYFQRALKLRERAGAVPRLVASAPRLSGPIRCRNRGHSRAGRRRPRRGIG